MALAFATTAVLVLVALVFFTMLKIFITKYMTIQTKLDKGSNTEKLGSHDWSTGWSSCVYYFQLGKCTEHSVPKYNL